MYDVFLAHHAERDLKRLSADLFHRIVLEIQALAKDPRPKGYRKLVGPSAITASELETIA